MEKAKKPKRMIFNFRLSFGILTLAIFFVGAKASQAASFYLSPPTGTLGIGQVFNVSVYVSSDDQAINAVQGTVNFPPDLLEVVNVNKTDSIVNLWVQEPSYSNTAGAWQLEGVIPNPGFLGKNGKILSAAFRAKKTGQAHLTITSGSALANDGFGTQILSAISGASYNLSSRVVAPRVPKEEIELPAALASALVSPPPTVSSPTHSDQEKWSADNNVRVEWTLPSDALGISILMDKFPDTQPMTRPEPVADHRLYQALEDGIWYFHISVLTQHGWSRAGHRQFKIDTKKPARFDIKPLERDSQPLARFIFDAEDLTSGIDYYEIQIDEEERNRWQDDGSHIYTTPSLAAGKHTLMVKAVDKAGNFIVSLEEFIIEPAQAPLAHRLYLKTPLAKLREEILAALKSTVAAENLHIRAINKARELRALGQIDKAKKLESQVRRHLSLSHF